MRIRIAIGVVFGLAAAFAFVFLQFRAEAMAQQVSVVEEVTQQVSPEEPLANETNPFGSNQVSSDSEVQLPAVSDSAGTTAVFAEDEKVVNEEPATSDPFSDDTPPSRSSKPLPPGGQSVDSDSESYDPFSSAGTKVPSEPSGAADAFASEFESGGDDFGSSLKEHPLRIIRLRTVRAVSVRAIIENIFQEEANKQRWIIRTEEQSNSLIFKGLADQFEQIKRLVTELDRSAATPVDTQKKTQSWPVPHGFVDASEDGSRVDAGQWPIRIIRLRHLKAVDFTNIAWELAGNRASETQLRSWHEAATNSVVVRGPAAEVAQIEQLALQLDQPAIGAGGGEFMDSSSESPADSRKPDVFITNEDSGWQEIDGPTVQTQRMRKYVAHHDQQSVALASEIRSLRRKYSSNHPKLAEARQKLEDVLEASFKLRLQLQGLEVAAIKSKLADIESRVQRRSQLRQQIINRRLHELLGEKDDLSWEVARTGPAQPSGSLDELLPPPDDSFGPDSTDFGFPVTSNDAVEEDLVPPTPFADFADGVEDVAPGVAPRVPPMPVAEFPIGVESDSDTALRNLPELDIDDDFEFVGGAMSAETPVSSRRQNGLHDSSRNEGSTWQLDLIVAENSVETASVKVEQIESRLSRLKGSDQEEDLEYELRLATLALDQAKKMLEQKRRWIEAQPNSLKVNIRYLEKNLEAAKAEHEHRRDAIEKVTGVFPRIDRRSTLDIEKAELRLKQAAADLAVFDVENRTSQNSETPLRPYQDAPAIKLEHTVIAKPRPTSRSRAVDDSIDGNFLDEPGIALPETSVPTESLKPSSPPETPTVVPEPDLNPVRSP